MFDEPPRHGAPEDEPMVQPSFEERVRDKARSIRERLCEPVVLGDQEHRLGASIGISLFPEYGEEASLLLGRADAAMYSAKKHEDTHICMFSEEMLARRRQRLSLEGGLQRAIGSDELEIHYQPVFRLDTQDIVAVEALLRWRQPDGTLLLPADFIYVAEEVGLMGQLGEWVLSRAARDLSRWHAQGYASV